MAIVKWKKKYERRVQVVPTPLRKTNADRIRQMTDEELAEFLESENGKPWFRCSECKFESCAECALEWLKKEADDS